MSAHRKARGGCAFRVALTPAERDARLARRDIGCAVAISIVLWTALVVLALHLVAALVT